jgi:hypothetical protein
MKHLAEIMWKAYAEKAGGVTFDGKPLPTWKDLGSERQSCWKAAAEAAVKACASDITSVVRRMQEP